MLNLSLDTAAQRSVSMQDVLQITIIGGAPLSGKTCLMHAILQALDTSSLPTVVSPDALLFNNELCLINNFGQGLKSGTDGLKLNRLVELILERADGQHVIFEADKHFDKTLFTHLVNGGRNIALRICILSGAPDTLLERARAKGLMYSRAFIARRIERIEQVKGKFAALGYVHDLKNETEADFKACAQVILAPPLSPLYRTGKL